METVKQKAGATFELKVGLIAKPQPTIEWFKDGKELESSAQVTIKHTFESTSLIMRDVTRLNSGMYEIKIKNSLGSAYGSIRVQIQGMSCHAESYFVFSFTGFSLAKLLPIYYSANSPSLKF